MVESPDVSEEDLARLRNQDVVSEVMNELGRMMPDLKRVLIDERDAYLAHKILEADGRRIVEFTKLAISGDVQSRQLTAALFHIAFICAYRIQQCSDICIEVNPRHVNFYKRMLGFQQLSEARENPKIQAPSVLMSLDLREAAELIQQFAGMRRENFEVVLPPANRVAYRHVTG